MTELVRDDDLHGDVSTPDPPENSPHPHGDKLRELLYNEKLPGADRERVEFAIAQYDDWRASVGALTTGGNERVHSLVDLVNGYKIKIECDLIFDSPEDFLYRSSGQLKLTSSILEEFLPDLISPAIFPSLRALEGRYGKGSYKAFAAASFVGTLASPSLGAGMTIRTKDHDFTVGRNAWIRASFHPDFPATDTVTRRVFLAFIAAECKTNLDKTMFQEAAATAHDLRVAIPGAKYYLLCEWLDMTPISTAGTDIQEAIILRGKRVGAAVRQGYATGVQRRVLRDSFRDRLLELPIRYDRIDRFVDHLRSAIDANDPLEQDVLDRGYF